ncbi:N-carbamyl-L-amino acid amidohydrolase [Chloropicon primus]|uniref:N-carbamyl-L-amino acid amidohydrolase n=1 Tax=Chloropicon primus TaxID=1764295 RepID=A0A5B8N1C1_9CHLO|nr:N-carbamyl-L-amino acid amidohydrolase [Chloropicon primus]UPR04871.1 N-carbamyl-L-amino acid amidohydrolase [Chloropicon primus]|eukprot:QDZ25675.1 N-carbamyl-L-amino acid amidohydrolase [Chloropicon primus]
MASSSIPNVNVMMDKVKVSASNLFEQIEALGELSDTTPPSITRILYSENDVRARDYVKSLMVSAGLVVREDSLGNIYGRLTGSEDDELSPVVSGSHADAIPHSGKYDGVLGVLGAIEALRAIRDSGLRLKRPVEALMFTSEEPTRFGLSCIGSRAMCGRLDAGYLNSLRDANGTGFLEACRGGGYCKDGATTAEVLEASYVPKGGVHAFVELHIEQGPMLEDEGLDIGVVTAIAAPASVTFDFVGNGGHAGALLMPYRRDAGLVAAELALSVEQWALGTKAVDTVATTGVLQVYPGAVNSVPREAHVEVDVRDIDEERRDGVLSSIIRSAEVIARKRSVEMEHKIVNQDPPAPCDASVIDAVQESANELGLTSRRMVSRAYHDALFMAQIAPTGMIFIPCKGGVSHRPDEFSSQKDMENGVRTLALAMIKLAGVAETCDQEGKEEL